MNSQMLKNKVGSIHAKRNNEEGFTLVELLVVITILGVLAAVVVFSVNGITDKSAKTACEADKSAVATAIETYRANDVSQAYPATLNLLVPNYIRELTIVTGGKAFTSNSKTITYFPSADATVSPPAAAGTLRGTC